MIFAGASKMNNAKAKKISVVIPIYNEEANLPSLLPRLLPVLDNLARPYDVILVDDGSRDNSISILKTFAQNYPGRIQVVELSRNFGQHPAILAGFSYVTGDVVVTLDADLQNPPEEIPKLIGLIDQGYDVVGGIRQQRQDSFFRRFASKIVNRVTVSFTGMELSNFGCMLRAYSRDVVDQINKCQENSTFIPALGLLFAHNPTEVKVAHAARAGGESKYSLWRLIRLNFDLMTGFSVIPLQLFTLCGFAVASGGLLFGLYLLIRRYILLGQSEAEGVFTLFAIAFVIMGVLMAGLGVVGEYIGRIYQEVRGRPRFVVRHIYRTGNQPVKTGIEM